MRPVFFWVLSNTTLHPMNTIAKQIPKVTQAISEIIKKFKDGELKESEEKYTVKWMKELGLSSK